MNISNSTLLISLLLIALFTSWTVSVGAQASPEIAVKLFNGRDGAGPSQDIPPGTFLVNGQQLGGSLDREATFSVQVPKSYLIRFCEDKGNTGEGAGKCEEYGEGTHNLQSSKFSFVKVWKVGALAAAPVPTPPAKPPVIVYEELNWGGRSQTFFPGMYRSFRGEFRHINDNMAMSTIIAKGFRVRFCEDEGEYARGSSDCEIHEEGRHNLRLSNSISFIEVIDLSDHSPKDETMPVILYEDRSQGGRMQGFNVGVFVGSLNQLGKVGNNQALSVTVKSGYHAMICADESTGAEGPANCEQFGVGKHNLRQKKTASYLKVSKDDK